jgi:hypothetical protein
MSNPVSCRYCHEVGDYGKPIAHAAGCPIVTGRRPRPWVKLPSVEDLAPEEAI